MDFAHTRPGKRIEETRTEVDRLPPSPFASNTVFDDPLARITPKSRGHLLADRYALDQSIGRLDGLFRAKDVTLRRQVVVKMLQRNWARDALIRDRFRHSVLALASIEHDNVVRVLDLVVAESALVMEYVSGPSLEQLIRERGPLDVRRAVRIATQICCGLEAAHLAGLVHGDLSPANVILCPDKDGRETPKLVGFDLAATAVADEPVDGFAVDRDPVSESTERRRGAREDVARVGYLLLFMLTGKKPSSRSVVLATTKTLTEVIERAIGKGSQPRFSSAHALAQALRAARHAAPASSERALRSKRVGFRRLTVGCLLAMVLGFVLAFYLARRQAERMHCMRAQPANLASARQS